MKILTKAQKTMSEFKTFKAEILNTSETSKTKSKTNLYQRNNSDGITEMRMESEYEIGKVKHAQIFITNREGQWQLTPKSAIKMEFQEAIIMITQQAMVGVEKEEVGSSKYSLSETAINGKSYWMVKETFSEDIRQKVMGVLDNPQMKEMIKDVSSNSIPVPALSLYRIGKEDGILYSTQQYDTKGNKLSDVTYEHVQINLPLADDIFVIPKNLKRKVAKTLNDYTTAIIQESTNQ